MSTSANFTSAKRPSATAAERKSPSASCIAGPWSPRRRNPLGGCGQWTSPVWSWAPPKIPGFIPFLRGYSICCKKLPIRQFFQPITKHISNQIDTHTHTHTNTQRERERERERYIHTYYILFHILKSTWGSTPAVRGTEDGENHATWRAKRLQVVGAGCLFVLLVAGSLIENLDSKEYHRIPTSSVWSGKAAVFFFKSIIGHVSGDLPLSKCGRDPTFIPSTVSICASMHYWLSIL